jgi:hypothetical protein
MASIIKADNIQKVSDGSNIIKKCGSTITLGSCGATISLAAGATQTGFGQTYSATSYCTTVKTAPFTAVAGKGYFVNTTCGAVTVTLPASPSAGDTVSVADYAGTWGTNNLTICRNLSKIGGDCFNAILGSELKSTSLIYIDATQGWKTINDATVSVGAPSYISATGGTITTCGDYKIHKFTADGCFSVSSAPTPANNLIDYLVVAGGGGGGPAVGWGIAAASGGGAGGYRESKCETTSGCWSASPLASATSLPVTATTYPITVGGGGAGTDGTPDGNGISGSNSIFSTITSAGGGGGTSGADPSVSGGSGGGGGWDPSNLSGGAGNTPPTSPPQGNSGGNGGPAGPPCGSYRLGGGGGAGAAGGNATPGGPPFASGTGGNGVTSSINATPTTRAGGGGPGSGPGSPGGGTGLSGGTGGGGTGGPSCNPGTAGTTNTGGGGGGGGKGAAGGAGGSGIVIIRYKYQ